MLCLAQGLQYRPHVWSSGISGCWAGQGLGGQHLSVPIPPWLSTPALQNICLAKCLRPGGEVWAAEARAHLVKEALLLPGFVVSSCSTTCPGCQD